MGRLDIYTLRATLAEGPLDQRVRVLERWHQELHKWHIFPVGLIMSCLQDFDARVRIMAIRILSSLAEFDEFEGRGMLAQWSMIEDPESPKRMALIEGILSARREFDEDHIEELIPLLRHSNSDVRNAIIEIFLEVSWYFDEERCMRIANFSQEENPDIQATINVFLQTLGQAHLVESEQSYDAGQ